jgi:hypothetical protein
MRYIVFICLLIGVALSGCGGGGGGSIRTPANEFTGDYHGTYTYGAGSGDSLVHVGDDGQLGCSLRSTAMIVTSFTGSIHNDNGVQGYYDSMLSSGSIAWNDDKTGVVVTLTNTTGKTLTVTATRD